MSFPERLKCIRKEKSLYQKDLAEVLGVSRVTISLYESGSRKPDHNTLTKIADYFGVSLDWLLGRTDERNKDKEKIELNELLSRYNVMLDSEELDDAAKDSVIKFLRLLKDRDEKINKGE